MVPVAGTTSTAVYLAKSIGTGAAMSIGMFWLAGWIMSWSARLLGGKADEHAALGNLIGPAVPYDQVADVVEDVVEAYLALRSAPEELFIDTVKRLGVEPFKERVYATR